MGLSFKRKSKPAEQDDPLADAENGQPEVKPAPFHALFRGADALDYVLMIFGTIGAMGVGAALPIFSIVFGKLLNTIGSPGSLMDQVNDTVLYILYVGAASCVGGYFQSAFWSWTAQRQVRRLREQYLRSALGQNVEFFDVSASTGGLLLSLSSDALIVQKLLGDKMGLTLNNSTMALTGVIIGFVYSWDITLVVLALMPLLAVAGALLGRMTTNIAAQQSEAYKEANACAQDSLSNIRTVTAFNMQDSLHSRYVTLLDKPATTTIQQGVISGSILAAFNISIFSAWGIGLYYGAVASVERGYTPGDVLAAFMAVVNGGFGLGQALPALTSFADARSAIARLVQVIDKQPAYNASTPGKQAQQLTGQIELQSVTFSYPSRPGTTIVKGLSLTIEATQRVALVGGSGSGKSTIIALIQRWYDPLEGRVLVDGVDIRDLHLGWLRAHMGLVSQEPTLFATSIRENIAFGRKGASQQEVEDAAKSAKIHKFIMSLPGGYDSLVGERGVQLSGGQKQRVAIARAILRSPKSKSQKDAPPLTLGLTMKPDDLTVFCPIAGTLLHYQVYDWVARFAPSDVRHSEWEFPLRNAKGDVTEGFLRKARHTWCHGDHADKGVAREPVLRQLYGWQDAQAMADSRSHTPYATRYALQSSLEAMGCSRMVIADIAGHNSTKSQDIYTRNTLRATAVLPDSTVGYMLPSEVARHFFDKVDMGDTVISPSILCSLRSAQRADSVPKCCSVDEELVAKHLVEALGEDRGVSAVGLILSVLPAKGHWGVDYNGVFPCIPLRLDGWANWGEVVHRVEEGRIVDVTPDCTKEWLKEQMDMLHAAQEVTPCSQPRWTLPSVGHLLGAFLRPLRATRVTLSPWGYRFQEAAFRRHLADDSVQLHVEQEARPVVKRAFAEQNKAVQGAIRATEVQLFQARASDSGDSTRLYTESAVAAPSQAPTPNPPQAPSSKRPRVTPAKSPAKKKAKTIKTTQVEFSLSVKGQAYFWQAQADMQGDSLVALHEVSGSKVDLLHDARAKLQGMDLGAWKLVPGKVRKNGHFWLI